MHYFQTNQLDQFCLCQITQPGSFYSVTSPHSPFMPSPDGSSLVGTLDELAEDVGTGAVEVAASETDTDEV